MKAQLVKECENGLAHVKLELLITPSATYDQRDREQHAQTQARRLAGSALLQRHERRAEARDRKTSEDAAVQDADILYPPHLGPAVGAVPHPPLSTPLIPQQLQKMF